MSEQQWWRVYATCNTDTSEWRGRVYDGKYRASTAVEAQARFERDFPTHTFLCCEIDKGPIGSFAEAAARVALILGQQPQAAAPGPRKPKPALPPEVWAEAKEIDYMAAVRAMCGRQS